MADKTADDMKGKVGDRMPDGTVYAGISPDTKVRMYAMPVDEPLTYTFNNAVIHAAANNMTNALGHDDWRIPTKGELNVLFQNRAAIGGFDESGPHPAGWYWSSSQKYPDTAWDQNFCNGGQLNDGLLNVSSLRLVR